MATCASDLREAGLPAPRTCEACGLGPCKRDHEDGAMRIAELEAAIRHAKVMADHGVHGEMGAVEACDEIHRALNAAVPSR